jgi:hypothetical protein
MLFLPSLVSASTASTAVVRSSGWQDACFPVNHHLISESSVKGFGHCSAQACTMDVFRKRTQFGRASLSIDRIAISLRLPRLQTTAHVMNWTWARLPCIRDFVAVYSCIRSGQRMCISERTTRKQACKQHYHFKNTSKQQQKHQHKDIYHPI